MLTLRRLVTLGAIPFTVAIACYENDAPTLPTGQPLVTVLLTDAPFPYDSVASLNVHVVRIEANEQPDTSGGGEWVLIDQPGRVFDLLELQQGNTALLGRGELPAGQYRAVKLTIDTGRSSVVWSAGAKAPVNWQNYSGSHQMPLYAVVESPVDVPTAGAEVVIDFDVGRSFLYDFFGTPEFTFIPYIRAVNSAATGAIAGTVTTPTIEGDQPVRNANVTVCSGGLTQPPSEACARATGRTDAAGHYRVAFLRAGTYDVKFEQPLMPGLDHVIVRDVLVTRGEETTVSVSLQPAGSSGAEIRVSGPTSVGVGGTIILGAVVFDENGNQVPNASVTWTSSDPTVATVTAQPDSESYRRASVLGRAVGAAVITAASDGLTDSHQVEVVGEPQPVASVSVIPDSDTLAVGDSTGFRAELRDAAGNLVTNRPVSWFTSDSAVLRIDGAFGEHVVVRALARGIAGLRATSEGKVGQASVTVR